MVGLVILVVFLFFLFGGVHLSIILKEKKRGLFLGACLFVYSFLAFVFWALCSHFLAGLFLGASRSDINYSNTVARIFSMLQMFFLMLLVPCVYLVFAGVFRKISSVTMNPRYASRAWRAGISFVLCSLFVSVFAIFVSSADAILRGLSRACDDFRIALDRMPFGSDVSPQWYEVLVRYFGWFSFDISSGINWVLALFAVILLFPLVNTFVFLFYLEHFILTETTRSGIARFYVFMWALGNIAIFPLVYSIPIRFFYIVTYPPLSAPPIM